MTHGIRLMMLTAMKMMNLLESFLSVKKVLKKKIHVQINHYGT